MRPVSAEQMMEIDNAAIRDYGIGSAVLMENAGRAAFEEIFHDQGDLPAGEVMILAGKGNNGGDGFVLARYLFNASCQVRVLCPSAEEIRKGPAHDNYVTARKMGIALEPYETFLGNTSRRGTLYVDALFGMAFRGELPGVFQDISLELGDRPGVCYSLDVPSGLNATDGVASVNCFKADVTISFGLPKTGFYMNDGPSVCGRVVVKDIGFPRQLMAQYL